MHLARTFLKVNVLLLRSWNRIKRLRFLTFRAEKH